MTIFGINLLIVGRAFNLEIAQLGTYRMGKDKPVTLYDTDRISDFLILPEDRLHLYNAWVCVPGPLTHNSVDTALFNKKKYVVPHLPVMGKLDKDYKDVFAFAATCEGPRIYDVVYTIAELNDMPLPILLSKVGIPW